MRLQPFAIIVLASCFAASASAAVTRLDLSPSFSRTDVIEIGPRLNYKEWIETKPAISFVDNKPFLEYYKVITYDVQGSLQDWFRLSAVASNTPGGNSSLTTGTLTFAAAEHHRLVNPVATFTFELDASHKSSDPDVSSFLGSGHDSSSLTAMVQNPNFTYFNRSGTLTLAEGSDTLDFTVISTGLSRDFNGLNIYGPKYDLGMHHVYDKRMLYDIPSSVPEPSTWMMLLGGGILLGALRRKRA
ncbi:PEP-CTERM sorting domain-containing protein [Massilia sp. BJB1822]|uniref:PEP-CTERM sorting domain-containing protein n=1 Tax=Massilia sp. BJB1822 TaxID=2744470 RepID=UPI001594C504|nr:PEP-CTERM sorting domain-containing protein [Massilia sp. BJB1822]NVE00793.1 PEP-CTERM sorting domain-containing protein [Massilia sp. BJB1822]